jgi:hypothetical protein
MGSSARTNSHSKAPATANNEPLVIVADQSGTIVNTMHVEA